MATGTITSSMRIPFVEGDNTQTPGAEYLQTSGSAATAGSVPVFASATSSNDFFLTSINISFVNSTDTAQFSLYSGKTIVQTFPTLGAAETASYSLAFGTRGIAGGTTTTATVSIVGAVVKTATVFFYASGWRLK